MGPLLPDTTALDFSQGGCVNSPGDVNAICADVGQMSNATICAAACAERPDCSAMTWHDANQGAWALHCVLRLDGVWVPRGCGAGCGHTAANKTSGWVPYSVPWPPAVAGFTGYLKPFWFGANSSGLDSPDTLALIARHAVGGYGWQQGHPGGGTVGVGEELLAQAGQHLRDYLVEVGNPNNTVLFVYRQIQVALRLFAQCALAADDPANDGFWLTDPKSGQVCLASQPWGTKDPYWDFTNSSAIDYWMDNVIAELTTEAALTSGGGAVFFDEVDQGECGYSGGTCTFSEFNATAKQVAKIVMLGRMVRALNAANIVPILSLDNRIAASGAGTTAKSPCALPEDDVLAALAGTTWVRFYENWPQSFWVPGGPDLAAAMVANAILEGQQGVPVVLHSSAACPAPPRSITRPGPLGGDVEFAVASYLVVATPGATISLSSNWYDNSFCWRPDFDVEYGVPTGPAVRLGVYTWARNFTRSTVQLDVQSSTGVVYLLP